MHLKSKQTCNIKDKNLGEPAKSIAELNDDSHIFADSATLTKCLNNYRTIACVAQYQQINPLKKIHHHVKMLESSEFIDVSTGNIDLPACDVLHYECSPKLSTSSTRISDLKNENARLFRFLGLVRISF